MALPLTFWEGTDWVPATVMPFSKYISMPSRICPEESFT